MGCGFTSGLRQRPLLQPYPGRADDGTLSANVLGHEFNIPVQPRLPPVDFWPLPQGRRPLGIGSKKSAIRPAGLANHTSGIYPQFSPRSNAGFDEYFFGFPGRPARLPRCRSRPTQSDYARDKYGERKLITPPTLLAVKRLLSSRSTNSEPWLCYLPFKTRSMRHWKSTEKISLEIREHRAKENAAPLRLCSRQWTMPSEAF